MSTLTIIIIIVICVGLATSIAIFVYFFIDDMRRDKRLQEQMGLYGTHVSDWEPTYHLEHKGFFAFNVPFVPDKNEVFYLENEYDKEANEFVKGNIEAIRKGLEKKGMTFVYLPDVKASAEEAKAMISYCHPGEDVDFPDGQEMSGIRSNFLLDYMVFPENRSKIRSCFAWYDDSIVLFNNKKYVHIFHYVSFLGSEALAHSKEILSEIIPEIGRERRLKGGAFCMVKRPKEIPADENFNNEDDLSEDDKKALEQIRKSLDKVRKKGISEAIIAKYINPYPKLSRMTITKDLRIILNDYKEMEITMEPLVKSVYIFFLRHPEGIMFKDLPDYRREFEIIYRAVRAKKNDIDRQMNSTNVPKISPNIMAVTDPTNNSINEKCSRIRNAFITHFHDIIASHYYIRGLKAGYKRIILPRNMVIWEDTKNA